MLTKEIIEMMGILKSQVDELIKVSESQHTVDMEMKAIIISQEDNLRLLREWAQKLELRIQLLEDASKNRFN